MDVFIDVSEANTSCKKVFVSYDGMMQAVMSAGSIYYLVISGFQAAAGQYQMDVRALDSSSVAGLQLRGSYVEAPAAAVAAASANASLTGPQSTCWHWRVAEDRNTLLYGDTIISIRVQSGWRRHRQNSHVGAIHDPWMQAPVLWSLIQSSRWSRCCFQFSYCNGMQSIVTCVAGRSWSLDPYKLQNV